MAQTRTTISRRISWQRCRLASRSGSPQVDPRQQEYANISLPGVASAAKVGATTFTIEMSVTPETFGIAQFDMLGFDIGLGLLPGVFDSDDSAPYCDARQSPLPGIQHVRGPAGVGVCQWRVTADT